MTSETATRKWVAVLLMALLFHFFLFLMRVNWSDAPPLPPRVELQEVNPRKLEEIRRKWREQDQSILIDKDKSRPGDKEAPDNARYFSDKNIRVEKEQRAKNGAVIPKPGSHSQPPAKAQPKSAPPAETPPQPKTENQPAKSLPKLGSLGVPFKLDSKKQKSQPKPRPEEARAQSAGSPGAQQNIPQNIQDKSVPEGSENLLNAQESVYYSFYARLYESIGPIWESRINSVAGASKLRPGDYTTHVEVVLDRQGNLLRVEYLGRCGVEEFDRAAHDSWNRIGRFPNPPSGLLDGAGEVRTGWTFTVHVGTGSELMFRPPERQY